MANRFGRIERELLPLEMAAMMFHNDFTALCRAKDFSCCARRARVLAEKLSFGKNATRFC